MYLQPFQIYNILYLNIYVETTAHLAKTKLAELNTKKLCKFWKPIKALFLKLNFNYSVILNHSNCLNLIDSKDILLIQHLNWSDCM